MESPTQILIIDDEKSIRDMLTMALKMEGYEVTAVSDGFEGIKKAETTKYDIVICDLKMPKISGNETLKAIKEVSRGIEVLVITGHIDIEEAKKVIDSGGGECSFLLKPFMLEDIYSAIRKIRKKIGK